MGVEGLFVFFWPTKILTLSLRCSFKPKSSYSNREVISKINKLPLRMREFGHPREVSKGKGRSRSRERLYYRYSNLHFGLHNNG